MAKFKRTNRLLSLVLAFALILTLIPGVAFGALAEETAPAAPKVEFKSVRYGADSMDTSFRNTSSVYMRISNAAEGTNYKVYLTKTKPETALTAAYVAENGQAYIPITEEGLTKGYMDITSLKSGLGEQVIYAYAVAVDADGKAISDIGSAQCRISALSPNPNITLDPSSGLAAVGGTIKVTFVGDMKDIAVPAHMKYYYTVDDGEQIDISDKLTAFAEDSKYFGKCEYTIDLTSDKAGQRKITIIAVSADDPDGTYKKTYSKTVSFVDADNALELSYNDGTADVTKTFNSVDVADISTFITENNIKKVKLTLKADVDISENVTTAPLRMTVPDGVDFTFDLNGHKYNADGKSYGLVIGSKAHVTIQDSSAAKTGEITAFKPVSATNGGTKDDPTVVNITGGTFISTQGGGTVISLSASDGGLVKAHISGGTIKSEVAKKGISLRNADALIENCTIEINGAGGMNDGVIDTNNSGASTVTLRNVTASAKGGVIFRGADNDKNQVIVESGTYTTTELESVASVGCAITEIKGGTFKCDTTDVYTAFYDCYDSIKIPENKFLGYDEADKSFKIIDIPEVKDSGDLSVINGGNETKYNKVEDAFKNVADGGTVKLNGDSSLVNCMNGIGIDGKSVTLDLNGHELKIDALLSTKTAGTITVTNGTLTLKDSSAEAKGKLTTVDGYGIVVGAKGNFVMQSGTIDSKSTYAVYASTEYEEVDADVARSVKIEGGTINASLYGIYADDFAGAAFKSILSYGLPKEQALAMGYSPKVTLSITGGTIIADQARGVEANNTNSAVISGGTIESHQMAAVYSSGGPLNINGTAKLINTGADGEPALFIQGSGIVVGGNAYIEAAKSVYGAIAAFSDNAEITIEGNARIVGSNYAIDNALQNGNFGAPTVNINGGYFKFNDLPFHDSSIVTYKVNEKDAKDVYILKSEPETEGDYAGYYTLTTRAACAYTDANGIKRTYQEIDGLVNALKLAKSIISDPGQYTPDSISKLQAAVDGASPLITFYVDDSYVSNNANANQYEFDYWENRITTAINNLKGVSTLDPENLADGTYSVTIAMYQYGKLDASMTSGAVDSDAVLTVEDGKATLDIRFKPLYQLSSWGHLLQMWTWNGDSRAAAKGNVSAWDGSADTLLNYSVENKYIDYYTPDSTPNSRTVCTIDHVHGSSDGKGAQVCYPYTVAVDFNYIDPSSVENSTYALRVGVDMMRGLGIGDQNVDMYVQWDTLQPISIEPTLRVSDEDVVLIAKGDSVDVTANLIAGSDQQSELAIRNYGKRVASATIKDGVVTITPLAEGTAKIVVSAFVKNEDGEAVSLSKTINVTVKSADAKAVTASSEVKDGAETVKISGDTIISGSKTVSVSDKEVVIDATAENAENVKSASIEISADAGKAFAAEGKPVVIKTDAGEITLEAKDVANGAKISIKKLDALKDVVAKGGNTVDFTADNDVAYEVSGLPATATVKVPFGGESGIAYTVKDNKLAARTSVTIDNGTASFAAENGTYALSENEYELAETQPTVKFVDVADDIYYNAPVYWAAGKGITNGTDATHFSPDLICNRAQLVTFLWRYAGSPEPTSTETPFTDVDVNSWYGKAVLWATEKGIVKGMTPTTFEPFTNVNRAQTITMIYRYEGSPAVEKSNTFTDVPSDIYYADAVAWGVANKIVQGMTPTTFEPDTECARAQAVTFLYRLANA